MPIDHSRFTQRVSAVAETCLGLILAATPVALWVAWSPEALAIVSMGAVISAGLLVLLDHRADPARGHGAVAGAPGWPAAALPDGFVEEVHQLFPLTYHHSFTEPARFRRAMRRLHRLVSAAAGGSSNQNAR